MVQLAAGRHGPLRRKPAEKIRGHRQRRFLRERAIPDLWLALRDVVLFWVDRGRAHLPRRQSAHQAAAVLGVDDRGGPRPAS